MKLFYAACLFFFSLNLNGQNSPVSGNDAKDSVRSEYVRVTYFWAKFHAYYEDGKVEDLKTSLNLDAHGIVTDQKLAAIFFKISNYFQKKGYYLVTSSGLYTPSSGSTESNYCEYIYRKDLRR